MVRIVSVGSLGLPVGCGLPAEPADGISNCYGRDLTWTTQKGEVLLIRRMESRHLFHSLRMLWNHFVPQEFRLEPFKRYRIRMPREYIISRFQAMLVELSKRDDLEDSWVSDLEFMRDKAMERIHRWRIEDKKKATTRGA